MLLISNQDGWLKTFKPGLTIDIGGKNLKRYTLVNGNEILFVTSFEVVTRGEDYKNGKFVREWNRLNAKVDEYNQKWHDKAVWIADRMVEIEHDPKQVKKYNEYKQLLNEILSMQKDFIVNRVKINGEWGIIVDGEFVPEIIRGQEVTTQITEALRFSLITGVYLGKIDTGELNYSNVIDGIAAQPLFPLSKFSGKFDEWNETFKHKGSKIKIHRASIENGTCEEVIQLIESLS